MRQLSGMGAGFPLLVTAALSIIVAGTMVAGPLIGQARIAAADAAAMQPAGHAAETAPVENWAMPHHATFPGTSLPLVAWPVTRPFPGAG
jgi:hypothetical protein